MWLGVVAGLTPFIWLSAFPAYALPVTANNQLVFAGPGWQTASSPQSCSQVSPTVYTTRNFGDSVSFGFLGNGVVVQGFVDTLSAPLLVILDSQVQRLSAPEDSGSGCGVIFFQENLTIASHNVTVINLSTTGSAQLTISGITAFPPDPAALSANVPTPTTSRSRIITPLPLPGSQSPIGNAVLPTITPPPSSPQMPNTSQPLLTSSSLFGTGNGATVPLMMIATSSSSQNTSTSHPSSASSSNTPFMTTRSMVIAVIGALLGALFAMLILLMVFILLRRRVSRNAAQKRDRKKVFEREPRGLEEGKIRTFESIVLTPETPKGRLTQFVEIGSVSSAGSIANPLSIMTGQPDSPLSILTPGSSTRSRPGIFAGKQQLPSIVGDSTINGTTHTPSFRMTPGIAAVDDMDQYVLALDGDGASLVPPSDRPPQAPSRLSVPFSLLAPSRQSSSPQSMLSHMRVSPWTSRSSLGSASTDLKLSSRTRMSSPRSPGSFALYPSREGGSGPTDNDPPVGFF